MSSVLEKKGKKLKIFEKKPEEIADESEDCDSSAEGEVLSVITFPSN
jgi:hypothetical protein